MTNAIGSPYQPTPSPSSFGPVLGQYAWAQFPRIDNYGMPDPFGGFPKPDSNIQVPDGYPITALRPGTVTAIDRNSDWGCAVTIKLDQPVNSIATHTAYLHLGGVASGLNVGSHVQGGQQVGTSGGASACGSQKVPVGFALYNGDVYGYGPTWNQYVGSTALNPVAFLNSFKSGTGNNTIPAQIVANTQQNVGSTGAGCDTPIVGGLICWLQNNVGGVLVRIGLFLLALVLIILGGVILIHPDPANLAARATGVAKVAAL